MVTNREISKIGVPLERIIEITEENFVHSFYGAHKYINDAPRVIEYGPEELEAEEVTLQELEFDVHYAVIKQVEWYFGIMPPNPNLETVNGNLTLIKDAMTGLNTAMDDDNTIATLILARMFSNAAIGIGLATKREILNDN